MAKRTATSELTDRNWDQEEEPEEAGHFTQASKEVMKERQIITAKRKKTGGTEGGSTSFSGFSGFSFKPSTTSTPFNFNVKSITNGNNKSETIEDDNKTTTGTLFKSSSSDTATGAVKKQIFSENLKKLNESVLAWIKQHVEKNPYCILSPIFKDYDKHLAELEKEKSEDEKPGEKEIEASAAQMSKATAASMNTVSSKEDFQFGVTKSSMSITLTASSTNGSSETKAPALTSFNFKPSEIAKPTFSFAVGSSKGGHEGLQKSSQEEEEEYVPPVAEVKTVEEEGAVLSIKCKLYYQKEGKWTDRGVGFVHLKNDDDKPQLLVRADTNLGNILLNIGLSTGIPFNMKNNTISMVCVPNPPLDLKSTPKPTPMLIRVKTNENAQMLLDKINELKK